MSMLNLSAKQGPGLSLAGAMGSDDTQYVERKIERDPAENERIEPVEDPAVTRNEAPGVLDPGVALESALNQVAGLCGNRSHDGDEGSLPPGEMEPRREAHDDPGEYRNGQSTQRPFNRLPRRNGAQRGAAEAGPDDHRENVGQRDQHDDHHGRRDTDVGSQADREQIARELADVQHAEQRITAAREGAF